MHDVNDTDAALTALIETQKASDAISLVLEGVEDKLHANGLSGALWAIEAILAHLAVSVDPAIEDLQRVQLASETGGPHG